MQKLPRKFMKVRQLFGKAGQEAEPVGVKIGKGETGRSIGGTVGVLTVGGRSEGGFHHGTEHEEVSRHLVTATQLKRYVWTTRLTL